MTEHDPGLLVLLMGASASGKSRLISGCMNIATASGLPELRVATRFTTRAPREAETLPGENQYLSDQQFEAGVECGGIDLHWSRSIGPDTVNRYGFSLTPELARGGAVILSANNYLCWPHHAVLARLRAARRLLVVRVCASPETRLDRLLARRPRLGEAELLSRMADVSVAALPPTDCVVPNDPGFQPFAEWEFLRLVSAFRFSAFSSELPRTAEALRS